MCYKLNVPLNLLSNVNVTKQRVGLYWMCINSRIAFYCKIDSNYINFQTKYIQQHHYPATFSHCTKQIKITNDKENLYIQQLIAIYHLA